MVDSFASDSPQSLEKNSCAQDVSSQYQRQRTSTPDDGDVRASLGGVARTSRPDTAAGAAPRLAGFGNDLPAAPP